MAGASPVSLGGTFIDTANLPAPSGWFAVTAARSVGHGCVVPTELNGTLLFAARTAADKVLVAERWCPHLGADLSVSSTVVGDVIQCGFHGFCFDHEGVCVSAYGRPHPAQLRTYPAVETAGQLLVFDDRGNGERPWALPDFGAGWSRFRWRTYEFRGHPLDTAENGVDVRHFTVVHPYSSVALVEPPVFEGSFGSATYRFRRKTGPGPLAIPVETQFRIRFYGLGIALIDARTLSPVRMPFRFLFLTTLIRPGMVNLRLGAAVPKGSNRLWRVAREITGVVLRDFGLRIYGADVASDRRFWETKRYSTSPRLAPDDGPIKEYRRWAQQFFAPPESDDGQADTLGRRP